MSAFEHIFTASDSFNIHIERVRGGSLTLYRRSSGEGWSRVSSLSESIVDVDVFNNREREFKVAGLMPTLCIITFADGTVEDVEIPEEEPSGYEVFNAKDGEFLSSDGKYIYVKI